MSRMIKKILAVTAIAVAASAVALTPTFEIEVGAPQAPSAMNVQAKSLSLICPGAAVNSGGATGTAVGVFDRIGKPSFAQSASASDMGVTSSNVGGALIYFGFDSIRQGSVGLNATQLQAATSPRLNGLLGASCHLPSTELLLIGGDTSTGRETLLLLSNPSSVSATVNLEVFAEGGVVQASGLSGIAVAANATTVVPLSSIIPETRAFSVKVHSRGAAIGAWLQQRTVRGLLYAGADFVSPATEVAKDLTIPGVLIRGAKDSADLIALNNDYSDTKPALRIFNPTNQTATFTAQIFGANAKTFGTVIRETIAANSTKDFDINGLADGDYVAFVKSDQSISAAIRLPRNDKTKKPNTDFTWLQSGSVLSGKQAITVPAAGISKLSLANPSNNPAQIKVNGSPLILPATSTIVLKVSGVVSIDAGANKIAANVVTDVSGTVTNFAVVDYRTSGSQLKVRVR